MAQIGFMTSQFQADAGMTRLMGVTVARTFMTFRATVTPTGAAAGGLVLGLVKTISSIDVADIQPLDVDERHSDWMLLRAFWPTEASSPGYIRGEVDLSAMRKLDELNDVYAMVWQATGGDTWNIQVHARTLLLLP